MADANITMGDYCYGTHRPAVYFARAAQYAREALALDPNSADAHAALGFIALRQNDKTRALVELQHAIALDPSYAPAHEWYGIALVGSGAYTEGLRQLKIAADLDPLSVATTAWLGSAAYKKGRFSEAVTYSQEALELAPGRSDALVTLGEAYEAEGKFPQAIDAFKRVGMVNPWYQGESSALLARVYAKQRRVNEARSALSFARSHALHHGTALENASRVNRVY
jgi:tetratricopeptide (TPR) repeat protein